MRCFGPDRRPHALRQGWRSPLERRRQVVCVGGSCCGSTSPCWHPNDRSECSLDAWQTGWALGSPPQSVPGAVSIQPFMGVTVQQDFPHRDRRDGLSAQPSTFLLDGPMETTTDPGSVPDQRPGVPDFRDAWDRRNPPLRGSPDPPPQPTELTSRTGAVDELKHARWTQPLWQIRPEPPSTPMLKATLKV